MIVHAVCRDITCLQIADGNFSNMKYDCDKQQRFVYGSVCRLFVICVDTAES